MKKFQQIIVLRALSNLENENYASLLDQKQQIMDMFKSMNHHRQNISTSTPDA